MMDSREFIHGTPETARLRDRPLRSSSKSSCQCVTDVIWFHYYRFAPVINHVGHLVVNFHGMAVLDVLCCWETCKHQAIQLASGIKGWCLPEMFQQPPKLPWKLQQNGGAMWRWHTWCHQIPDYKKVLGVIPSLPWCVLKLTFLETLLKGTKKDVPVDSVNGGLTNRKIE